MEGRASSLYSERNKEKDGISRPRLEQEEARKAGPTE
jgi:hypothetical protein